MPFDTKFRRFFTLVFALLRGPIIHQDAGETDADQGPYRHSTLGFRLLGPTGCSVTASWLSQPAPMSHVAEILPALLARSPRRLTEGCVDTAGVRQTRDYCLGAAARTAPYPRAGQALAALFPNGVAGIEVPGRETCVSLGTTGRGDRCDHHSVVRPRIVLMSVNWQTSVVPVAENRSAQR